MTDPYVIKNGPLQTRVYAVDPADPAQLPDTFVLLDWTSQRVVAVSLAVPTISGLATVFTRPFPNTCKDRQDIIELVEAYLAEVFQPNCRGCGQMLDEVGAQFCDTVCEDHYDAH